MKKIYTLAVMAIIAFATFQASAYSITLRFDNKSAIGSITVYSDSGKTQVQQQLTPASEVTVTYDDNSRIIDIVAADGYALSSCVFQTTRTETYFQNSYRGNHEIYCSSGYDEAIYTYTTVNMAALRTNTATVTVNGDASKVALQFSETQLSASLQNGVNTVKFMGSESPFTISSTVQQPLYSVLLNGDEQATASGNNWSLAVRDGDNIVINADFPDEPCNISFAFATEGTQDYITGVYINREPVADWQNGISAKDGDNFFFTVNSSLYKMKEFRVNGETKMWAGSYETWLRGDALQIYLDVEPYGTCVAHVSVDNPERLKYRVGYSGSYETLPSAAFDISLSEAVVESTPVNFIVSADNYYVTSITADGNELAKGYDGSYTTKIADGMNINIVTGEIVRDKTAYFYFHNPSAATDYTNSIYGYDFSNAYISSISLQQGYNKVCFGDEENPFVFLISGNVEYVEPMVWFYKNGELTAHTDPNNGKWSLEYADNDVMKVYIGKNEPETKVVSIHMPVFADGDGPQFFVDYVKEEFPVKGDSPAYSIRQSEAESADYTMSLLPGTLVTVKPNGYKLAVTVDDEKLDADEDGNYSFSVGEANPSVNIEMIPTGVNDFAAGQNLDSERIYNLQGIEVKIQNLPAGIYIKNGQKIIIK